MKKWLMILIPIIVIGLGAFLIVNFMNSTTFEEEISDLADEFGEISEIIVYEHSGNQVSDESVVLDEQEEIYHFLDAPSGMELKHVSSQPVDWVYSLVVFREESQTRQVFFIAENEIGMGGNYYEVNGQNELIEYIDNADLDWRDPSNN
ncbi:hypothetical protein J2Z83_002413 [Virgibacillus natechei]|uniref:DUF5590 domain-containing protein n=1 Tax=Virgibacillus natechei TaxID=1216297 RepID=A0ABS4II95_9BACI|nr:hypothetical protein [Virgibacillus natechei]MBP1970295.1 hypothetical protein [Virgibacillus natechei]UZD13123.1 hypothetical protein OLD84_00665 [Virgibacillus natechei]